MASAEYQEIKEIFFASLEFSSQAERESFLANKCSNENVRREVELLFAVREEASDFLKDVSAISVVQKSYQQAEANKIINRKIDKYRIEREIGRGGMGTVFLANREDFRQQVALKLIKRGMDSDAILERFKREREILASLDHPFIARLLDGGTTDEEAPFFVMEYVEGVTVDEYCRRENLSIDERLKLFRKICEAVTFAHQKQIIHRDLKPSNILVTADGTPKLLDFGIAKLLNSNDVQETQAQQRLLTPAYASPEQLLGEPVSATSDVFSLGVIFYELLTGNYPFGLKDKSPEQALRIINTTTPPLPSVAVNNQQNTTGENQIFVTDDGNFKKYSATKINPKLLRGDLDNIVLTALKPESQRRYATVEEFSADIGRFQTGLPVKARRQTPVYRIYKFASRHRLTLIPATIGVFALTFFGGDFAFQNSRYQAKISELETISKNLNDVSTQNKSGQSLTKAKFEMAQTAVENLSRLQNELGEKDRNSQINLASAYVKLGDLQGKPYTANIGDASGARASYEKALEILNRLAPSDEIEYQQVFAGAEENYAYLLAIRFEEIDTGRNYIEQAKQRREAIYQSNPQSEFSRRQLAQTLIIYSDIYSTCGSTILVTAKLFEDSLPPLYQAVSLHENLLAENPQDLQSKRDLAIAYQRLAHRLYNIFSIDKTALSKVPETVALAEKALMMRKEIAESNDATLEDSRYLADEYLMTGIPYLEIGRLDEALADFRRSQEIFQTVFVADPQNTEIRRDIGNSLLYQGLTMMRENHKAEARKQFLQAQQVFQQSFEIDHTQSDSDEIKKINEYLGKIQNFPIA